MRDKRTPSKRERLDARVQRLEDEEEMSDTEEEMSETEEQMPEPRAQTQSKDSTATRRSARASTVAKTARAEARAAKSEGSALRREQASEATGGSGSRQPLQKTPALGTPQSESDAVSNMYQNFAEAEADRMRRVKARRWNPAQVSDPSFPDTVEREREYVNQITTAMFETRREICQDKESSLARYRTFVEDPERAAHIHQAAWTLLQTIKEYHEGGGAISHMVRNRDNWMGCFDGHVQAVSDGLRAHKNICVRATQYADDIRTFIDDVEGTTSRSNRNRINNSKREDKTKANKEAVEALREEEGTKRSAEAGIEEDDNDAPSVKRRRSTRTKKTRVRAAERREPSPVEEPAEAAAIVESNEQGDEAEEAEEAVATSAQLDSPIEAVSTEAGPPMPEAQVNPFANAGPFGNYDPFASLGSFGDIGQDSAAIADATSDPFASNPLSWETLDEAAAVSAEQFIDTAFDDLLAQDPASEYDREFEQLINPAGNETDEPDAMDLDFSQPSIGQFLPEDPDAAGNKGGQ